MGTVGDGDHLQPARRQEPDQDGRADAREDLHGPDHVLERSGDPEAQQGRQPAAGTNELSIVNPPKKFPLAYPISTYTYVIVPTKSAKAADLRKFLFWAVTKGQTYGPKLLFEPIPKPVLVVAEKTIKKIQG